MLISETQLIAQVSEILFPFGCIAAAVGPHQHKQNEVGHVYGPSIIVRSLRDGLSKEMLDRMATEVTSRVAGITGLSLAG